MSRLRVSPSTKEMELEEQIGEIFPQQSDAAKEEMKSTMDPSSRTLLPSITQKLNQINTALEISTQRRHDELDPMIKDEGDFEAEEYTPNVDRTPKPDDAHLGLKIEQEHRTWRLEENQFSSAKEYMRKVMYQVPLNKLYKVIASCQYEEGADFCPVLVKIVDKYVLEKNDMHPFLLQVWSIKGEMIFEKRLMKPPENWNISGNKLIYMEENSSNKIFLVKLFLNSEPVIFEFELPKGISGDKKHSGYDAEQDNYLIPEEDELPDFETNQHRPEALHFQRMKTGFGYLRTKTSYFSYKSKKDDLQHMQAMGEAGVEDYKMSEVDSKEEKGDDDYDIFEDSVYEIFRDNLIVRAPDKMIDYFDGYIMLAFRNVIFYVRVDGEKINTTDKSQDTIRDKIEDSGRIRQLNLSSGYKIVCIQPLGSELSSIVLEELRTRQIRFIRVDHSASNNQLKFVQLGVLVNHSPLTASKLVKYRSVCKTRSSTGKKYQVGVVVRENGRVEFYSDFILVNEYYNPRLQCIDIATDLNQFFLKFVKDAHLIKRHTSGISDLKIQVRHVPHFWRNRLSFNTTKVMKTQDWGSTIHKRIAGYFKLYSQILNFSKFMLVAHRDMISVFDMTKRELKKTNDDFSGSVRQSIYHKIDPEDQDLNGRWIQTLDFKDKHKDDKNKHNSLGHIRQMIIKKRSKEERNVKLQKLSQTDRRPNEEEKDDDAYKVQTQLTLFQTFRIVCIIGTHSIVQCKLNFKGKLSELKTQQAPGRIIRFMDDQFYQSGVLMLCDKVKDKEDYREQDGADLWQFPFQQEPGSICTLYAFKMGKEHELMTETNCKSLDFDSTFSIMLANKENFVQSEEHDNDELLKNYKYKGKEQCKVLICTSQHRKTTQMFPLLKDKDDKRVLKSMRLALKDSNTKTITLTPSDKDDSPLLESFYITKKSFGKYKDNYVQVTEKSIRVYNRNMKLRLIFEGMCIRGCQQAHQRYLYTISDTITSPPTITYVERGTQPEPIKNHIFLPSGFYCYDLEALLEGKVEKYNLGSSIGGQCCLLSKSKFGNRFSYLSSYDELVVIPFPHINQIECVGMGHKSEYLIWREKNGFFTALDGQGDLLTWSLVTGKLLYREQNLADSVVKKYGQEYQVYRADENDLTYTQNFYGMEDRSLQLLKSKKPIYSLNHLRKNELRHNETFIKRQFEKVEKRNRKGTVKIDKNVPILDKHLFTEGSDNSNVIVKNSRQKSDLHHFKVMQLRSHEDTGEGSECKVLFHFFFDIFRQKKQEKNDKLEKYEWDINDKPQQFLYLSKDTMRMMEVVNNFTATVYYRGTIDDEEGKFQRQTTIIKTPKEELPEDDGQLVQWKVQFRIKRYPKLLAQQTSVPFLFSPDFTFQFEINLHKKQFNIIETANRFVYINIPTDLLNTSWFNLESKKAIQLIVSRFKWVDNKIFRFVNKSNLDCMFEMCTDDPQDKDQSRRYLKLLSAVKIDNLHENRDQLNSSHIHDDRCPLEDEDVLERLIRMNQAYKTNLTHALNLKKLDKNLNNFKLLPLINKIDFTQPWTDPNSSFDIENTFTWLDWRIIDRVEDPELDFYIDNIDSAQKLQLCFNILPNGQGMMHVLASSLRTDAKVAQMTAIELFRAANRKYDYEITAALGGCKFEVPILPNIQGQTPLDICLGLPAKEDPLGIFHTLKKTEQEEGSFEFQRYLSKVEKTRGKKKTGCCRRKKADKSADDDEQSEKKDTKKENIAMAEVILKGMKNYSFMHSSHFTKDAFIEATRLGSRCMSNYLDQRMRHVKHSFDSKTQRTIKKQELKENPAMGEYGSLCTGVWVPEREIKNVLFDETSGLQPMELQYIDMPDIHRQTKAGQDFMYALYDQEVEDLSVFAQKSVQIIIDMHFEHWRLYNTLFVGLPIYLQLVFFTLWSDVVLPNLSVTEDFQVLNNISWWILFFICSFQIFFEGSALVGSKEWSQYIMSWTRPLKFISPLLMLIVLFMKQYDLHHTETFWTIQCWSALMLWQRFLLFLRTKDSFAWYIRLILDSFYDMYNFLVVILIGVLAFASTVVSIEEILRIQGKKQAVIISDDADWYERYASGWVEAIKSQMLTVVGQFTEDLPLYRTGDWIIFILALVINLIVLFNLLIAIVSETYDKIKENWEEERYKEKTSTICQLQDTILGYRKMDENPNELIFVAKHIETIGEEEENQIAKQFTGLQKKLSQELDNKLFAFKVAITKELRALRNDLPINAGRKVPTKTISQEHLDYLNEANQIMSPNGKNQRSSLLQQKRPDGETQDFDFD